MWFYCAFLLFASIPFSGPIMYFGNVLYKVAVTNVEAITKLGVIKLDWYTALLMGVEKQVFRSAFALNLSVSLSWKSLSFFA